MSAKGRDLGKDPQFLCGVAVSVYQNSGKHAPLPRANPTCLQSFLNSNSRQRIALHVERTARTGVITPETSQVIQIRIGLGMRSRNQ